MHRRGFIVTTGPVNRRTRQPSTPAACGEPSADRIRGARSRIELGLPLALQLPRRPPRGRAGLPLALVLLAVVMSLPLVFPGALQSGGWLIAAGATVVIAGALVMRRPGKPPMSDDPLAWIDHKVLHAFDRLLATSAAEVEPEHRERLGEIKAAVVAIACMSEATSEPLSPDDRHFVVESLRRYLPDSMAAYLAVPRAQRLRRDPQAPAAASELFGEQLQLLRDELRQCEARATRRATEGLRRQQRFLASRCGSR